MRLWHETLLPLLPVAQLSGQHREVCALRGMGWGKSHSTINYIYDHPFAYLVAYHERVTHYRELKNHRTDPLWLSPYYRGLKIGFVTVDDNFFKELEEARSRKIIYPEHNTSYMRECLDNLKNKGIIIEI